MGWGAVNYLDIEYRPYIPGAKEEEGWIRLTDKSLKQYHRSGEYYNSHKWDIREMASGFVEVRFIVTDNSGVSTFSDIYTYEIDHTAPDAPQNVAAENTDGVITISWEPSPSADCRKYYIYRRKVGDESYKRISSLLSTPKPTYSDNGIEIDGTYEYIVTAEDDLKNESPLINPVTVFVGEDAEPPEVKSFSPSSGRLSGEAVIKAEAEDNRSVAEVSFFIRSATGSLAGSSETEGAETGSEEADSNIGTEAWTELGIGSAPEKNASGGLYSSTLTFDTTRFPDGSYQIRAEAADASGNRSSEYYRSYEIDNTGVSQVEGLTASAGSTYVQLGWTDVTDDDFKYYLVEKLVEDIGAESLEENKNTAHYEEAVRVTDYTGCVIENLTPETEYTFRVCGVDTSGNKGEYSESVTVKTEKDTVPPRITEVYPAGGPIRDNIPLVMTVTDNHEAACAVWSLSFDGENFKPFVAVYKNGGVLSGTALADYLNVLETTPDEKEKRYDQDITEAFPEAAEDSSASVSGTGAVRTFRYNLDITDESSYPEGELLIRCEAYDRSGNKNALTSEGKDVELAFLIDRTAPEKIRGVRGTAGDGYIHITWEAGKEEDIQSYQVYRARMIGNLPETLEQGGFTCIMDAPSLDFYDTDTEDGESYAYYVTARDVAGNATPDSDVTFATALPDVTPPEILGVSPTEGKTIGKSTTFTVAAADNSALSRVYTYGRKDADSPWTLLQETSLSGRYDMQSFTLELEEAEEGRVEFRFLCEDRNGNQSDEKVVTCTLDKTSPEAELTLKGGHFEITSEFSRDYDLDDFSRYELYRCELFQGNTPIRFYQNAQKITTITAYSEDTFVSSSGRKTASYSDPVTPNVNYRYAAKVYDKAGNYSWTAIRDAKADDVDLVAPTIVLPEKITAATGQEIILDAGESFDNVRIRNYTWEIRKKTAAKEQEQRAQVQKKPQTEQEQTEVENQILKTV